MAILRLWVLSAIFCHKIDDIRAFWRYFLGKKQKVLSKKTFFRFICLAVSLFFRNFATEERGTFRNYVPTQRQIRPDVVSSTSRRSARYVLTQYKIRPDAISSTS